jgi:hypothetical protein
MSLTDALNWLTLQLNPYVVAAIFAGYFVAVGRLIYLTHRAPKTWETPWERAQRLAEEDAGNAAKRDEEIRVPHEAGRR